MRKETTVYCILSILAVIILFLANLFWGAVRIPASEVWHILCGAEAGKASWEYIVLDNRLPQACTALLCGCALATSGLILQTCFKNPLADPSILGINSGASMGVAVVILFMGGSLTTDLISLNGFLLTVAAALGGAMLIIALLLFLSSILRNNMMLLITGIMISYLTSSSIALLNYQASADGVFTYMIWGLGSFANVSLGQLPVFSALLIIGLAGALLLIKPLNALLLGERYAENLGIPMKCTRNILLWVTGLLTATTTAFCGPISFIGLAVPHLARILLRTAQHQYLMPATMFLGGALSLLCNLLCNLPGTSGSLPLNVVTPIIGAPTVIYIILKQRNNNL